jgi:4'-phosphopantetheinyl transferase
MRIYGRGDVAARDASRVRVRWAEQLPASDLLDLLDAVERDRLAGYRSSTAASAFASGVAMLKCVVGDAVGSAAQEVELRRRCPDCGGPHGKVDTFSGHGVHTSLAHAGRVVVVALSESAPVGVDVEPVVAARGRPTTAERDDGQRDLDDLERSADGMLHPDEVERLAGLPQAERARWILGRWVVKEAALKATGDGLRLDPRKVSVADAGGGTGRRTLAAWDGVVPPSMALWMGSSVPGHLLGVAMLTSQVGPPADVPPHVSERPLGRRS